MSEQNEGGLLASVQAQLDGMSSRDRRLLAGLVAFFAIVLVGFVTYTLRGRLDDKASRVVDQKRTLTTLQEYRADYLQATAEVEAAEQRLIQYGGQPVPAYLEKAAAVVGVRDALSVNKQGEETVGRVTQTRYKVELPRISYDLALNFIYDIETSGYPLKIDTTRIRSVTYKGERMVNLSLELLTYTLQEGGG